MNTSRRNTSRSACRADAGLKRAVPEGATQSDLAPESVVALVLAALQRNDLPHTDAGIETLYAFAAARLHAQVGDLGAFKRVLHNELFAPLLGHASANPEPLERRGGVARQTVMVEDGGGAATPYLFSLVEQPQPDGPPLWLLSGLSRADLPS